MRPIVIPQIKKPSMVYGLGVASHLINIEKALSLNDIALDMKDKKLQELLESNGLLSGLSVENSILNCADFENKVIKGDEDIELSANGSCIHMKISGNHSVKVNISNDSISESEPEVSKNGISPSVIIAEVMENSDAALRIVYDTKNSNINVSNAFLLKVVINDNSKLSLNELFITDNDSFRRTSIALKGKNSIILPSHTYFTHKNARVDFKSEVTHYGENSESDMKVRGIISEKSQVITQGHVTIKPSAFNSNGYQQEDLMLVGKDSVARPIPNLEIGNNEVRCSHGATVSNVDEDTLFYLQSRGIKRQDALSLVLSSFLSPIMGLFSPEEKGYYQKKLKLII